jgi:hypothetical protein
VKIDKTAPVLAGSRNPPPNVNGWNNTDVNVSFVCSDAGAGVATVAPAAPVVVSTEGSNQSVGATCVDAAGNAVVGAVGSINVDKTKPVSDVAVNPAVIPVNSAFNVTATVIDAGSGADAAEYSVNGEAYIGMTVASGQWGASAPPRPVGVYSVCVRSKDKALNQGDAVCILAPVYDPGAGFVTGGGWISSPTGAYAADPLLAGKAQFGFVARYHNGANVPTGNTEFQFQTASLQFKSASYEWLVVAGARAKFKGSGTLNGAGDYGFMLTAIDGQISGGGGVDKFRIKIWQKNGAGGEGAVVYDNQMGKDGAGDDATALGGGSVVIHR